MFQDELQLQLKLFQLYHNKQELTEKREIADKKKEEVAKLEKRKETSDEETKLKRKELASYNKELAADEQKVNELVNRQNAVALGTSLPCRKYKSTRIDRRTSKPRRTPRIIRRNSIWPSKSRCSRTSNRPHPDTVVGKP